jgi:hypothetical protein
MVRLHITAIEKAMDDSRSATEMFTRLNRRWYLSMSARWNREHVIALIQQTIDDYPDEPVLGQERSSDIIWALDRAGYVSIFGRTWGKLARER